MEFEKFVEKLRDQQTKEESAKAKGEEENPSAPGDDDDEDKNKTKSWKKRVTDFGKNCKTRLASVGRRVKQAAKWLWERRKIKNKRSVGKMADQVNVCDFVDSIQAIGTLLPGHPLPRNAGNRVALLLRHCPQVSHEHTKVISNVLLHIKSIVVY